MARQFDYGRVSSRYVVTGLTVAKGGGLRRVRNACVFRRRHGAMRML
ncbi:hypothetical protein PSAB6_390015 [Paraburkholderia sabiae]|nr:hypothetical protein PSAB6_390015 [Paraburkholderia sabiae]